ncbi:MAG TPA: polynucleotide kinase-phosphatase [Terriglobales bacterium]|nr:polynucleotide kinase-phosphatase [Terriglobales bacterium]
MKVTIPDLALVALIGPSGSGKSTFAARHFLRTEVVSSDFCRGLVADDENDQDATPAAFRLVHAIAGERLRSGRLVVVDATNVQPEDRRPLVQLAREHNCFAVAVVFDVPEAVCIERNRARPERDFHDGVVRRQHRAMRRSLRGLEREGFRYVSVLRSVAEVDAVTVERQPLWVDRRSDPGPFDIIGDVHGCREELVELLGLLGYGVQRGADHVEHPDGRRVIFVGDLVDRGPDTPGVLRLVMRMVEDGVALAVAGNHDARLVRALKGRNVKLSHGLERTLQQLEADPGLREPARAFLDGLISHYVLDGGRLVVAHAGLPADLQGRSSGRVREFAMYGDTTGETDELGLPVRLDWAAEYRGRSMVVYGHVAVPEARWLNNTVNIDTGCVFGGRLTALRYPEREVVSVPARATYFDSVRPLAPPPTDRTDVLDLADVLGKRLVETSLAGRIAIREENATAALEVMSRFAIDPRLLVYLPPTMSPAEASARPGLLEHPEEALAYFARSGVRRVVCEEKHMGSRAVLVVCRDEAAAERRFGVAPPGGVGVCHTRTGRSMFEDGDLERRLLDHLRCALAAAGFWERLETDWVCLDCELMPWSAKAQELITRQYAPVASAGLVSVELARAAVGAATGRGVDMGELDARLSERGGALAAYREAYRRYCWPVGGVEDLRLAPFHVLATEGHVHTDQQHGWHLDQIAAIVAHGSPVLALTPHRVVDVEDAAACQEAADWWTALTAAGGEGMVVKPLDFVVRGSRGLVQPGIKCRGAEYLRIIYGPEYDLPGNLERLRRRGVSAKRSLALREFALGVEALERFVKREPLHRVHECVFGVLALESEPVDPAL